MSTFDCTPEQLKQMAVEFLKAAHTMDLAELDNGFKCFGLHYLGCKYEQPADTVMVPSLYKFVAKKYQEYEFSLGG